MELDRGGADYELIQLLGVEHSRRVADAAHCKRQHADDTCGDAEPTVIVARLQPVRAQPGHI